MATRFVRVTARRDFSFKGKSYSAGQAIEVSAIEAVQMGHRNVSYKRVKAEQPIETPLPKARRRKTMAEPMTAKPVVEAVPEPAVVQVEATEQAPEYHADNTYERKDLRAED